VSTSDRSFSVRLIKNSGECTVRCSRGTSDLQFHLTCTMLVLCSRYSFGNCLGSRIHHSDSLGYSGPSYLHLKQAASLRSSPVFLLIADKPAPIVLPSISRSPARTVLGHLVPPPFGNVLFLKILSGYRLSSPALFLTTSFIVVGSSVLIEALLPDPAIFQCVGESVSSDHDHLFEGWEHAVFEASIRAYFGNPS